MDHTSTWLTVVCESEEPSDWKHDHSLCLRVSVGGEFVSSSLTRDHTLCKEFPPSRAILQISSLVCHAGHCLSHLTKFGQAPTDSYWHLFFVSRRGKEMLGVFKIISHHSGLGGRGRAGKKENRSLIVSQVIWEEEQDTDWQWDFSWLVWIIEECGLISLSAGI